MNEWLDLFGLDSVWDDPDWPSLADVFVELREEQEKKYKNIRKIQEETDA